MIILEEEEEEQGQDVEQMQDGRGPEDPPVFCNIFELMARTAFEEDDE